MEGTLHGRSGLSIGLGHRGKGRSHGTAPSPFIALPSLLHPANECTAPGCCRSSQVVDYLLQEGADANAHDQFGVAPLHKAVGHGQVGH